MKTRALIHVVDQIKSEPKLSDGPVQDNQELRRNTEQLLIAAEELHEYHRKLANRIKELTMPKS